MLPPTRAAGIKAQITARHAVRKRQRPGSRRTASAARPAPLDCLSEDICLAVPDRDLCTPRATPVSAVLNL